MTWRVQRPRVGAWMVGLAAVAILGAGASDVDAQRRIRHEPVAQVGVSFIAADPVGDLGLFIDQGFGAQVEGRLPVAADGHLRIRGDLGFIIYGYERQRYCYAVPIGCRIEVDLTTTNSIFFGGVGPEIVLARGAIEPYVNASVGFAWFGTRSSLSGEADYDDYASTTHYSDLVLATRLGGGLRLQVKGGRKPIALDLGVERHHNGVAEFLTEGDIEDHPDGSITLYPNRSEANYMTFRFGISIGVPRDRGRR